MEAAGVEFQANGPQSQAGRGFAAFYRFWLGAG